MVQRIDQVLVSVGLYRHHSIGWSEKVGGKRIQAARSLAVFSQNAIDLQPEQRPFPVKVRAPAKDRPRLPSGIQNLRRSRYILQVSPVAPGSMVHLRLVDRYPVL